MKKSANKVSVIVATYNNHLELQKTINSFVSQKYSNKELIIIDGGSIDGTIEIIKKNQKRICRWVSEKDKGIADAFNKGVAMASGDYIYFFGAGDYFWKNDVLTIMMVGTDPNKDLLVCGKINRVSKTGKKIRYTSSIKFRKWHLLYKMGLPHQGLFMSKKYFEKFGQFDTSCKYAMDYELLLRSYSCFPKIVLKDIIVAAWKEGGIGKEKTLEIFDEYKRIKQKNRIAPTILISIIDILSRIKYFIEKITK